MRFSANCMRNWFDGGDEPKMKKKTKQKKNGKQEGTGRRMAACTFRNCGIIGNARLTRPKNNHMKFGFIIRRKGSAADAYSFFSFLFLR